MRRKGNEEKVEERWGGSRSKRRRRNYRAMSLMNIKASQQNIVRINQASHKKII